MMGGLQHIFYQGDILTNPNCHMSCSISLAESLILVS